MTTISDLAAEATAIKTAFDVLGAGTHVQAAEDIGVWAIEYALRGWPVLPLRGKVPAIKGGNGFKDATTDIDRVVEWWGGPHAGTNIGIRPPAGIVVLDVDEHGQESGTTTMKSLTDRHGQRPETMTTRTGTGWHLFLRHPGGKLTADRLPGVDLKDHNGYVVAPPSIHPSGRTYQRVGRQDVIADMPAWLVSELRPIRPAVAATAAPARASRGSRDLRAWSPTTSIADAYSAATTWAQVLEPHGWTLVGGGGDGDGSRWRHPTATAAWSATVRHDCLFIYSHNTPFPVCGDGAKNGITRFRAYSILNHGGDMSAAATALKGAAA